jgi:glycosyltransferase involved in cell wall biosynthesis
MSAEGHEGPAAGGAGGRSLALAVFVDRFPTLTETFVVREVEALMRAGHRVRVEARVRPTAGEAALAPSVRVSYRDDDRRAARLRDLVWLLARHPWRSARDVWARRRWRREEWPASLRELAPAARRAHKGRETHLHAHFAAGAALDSMRVAALVGCGYGVTAHAYDIYSHPRNLVEKLERADVVTSGCDYTVADLRAIAPRAAARIHKVVMGVDPGEFRRGSPLRGGRSVLAVGRLVEKKGFADLIEAAALLERHAPLDRVEIVGDGPEAGALEDLVAARGLSERVVFAGARRPGEVRELMEAADVLAVPSVVAHDGDRDSMPVVVKEALALELVVAASDEVGLPEVVRPPWGRLAAPADPASLAAAIEELLALGREERAAAGRAGREWVREHADVDREASRLAVLVASSRQA